MKKYSYPHKCRACGSAWLFGRQIEVGLCYRCQAIQILEEAEAQLEEANPLEQEEEDATAEC